MKIKAYRRPDGLYGIRNHLLVIPTSVCAADTAAKIAALVPGAVSIPNQHGCCQIGSDLALTQKTIVGFGKNPNVGAVLVVGLGCDGIQARNVAAELRETGKPVEFVVIQECGGTLKTIARGAELMAPMARDLSTQERVECDMGEIVMGLECGGSDPTSGIASNPTIGYASNKLIAEGGSSILSETTEVIGAEHLIAARFEDPAQRDKFLAQVKSVEDRAIAMGEDLRSGQPTPGNKEGGLSTIEEKSLGCMYKAGTAPFKGALDYAEIVPPEKRGMYFMDTPGQDIDSITGMVAGGAQLVIFSTGRGTPTGSPITPVIKITGNPDTYAKMPDNLDVNAGRIISDGARLEEIGEEVFGLMVDVCNGRQTKAESLGHHEFGIYKLTGTF
ncbi:MAG: UxaA family hydrolase [Desulfovibrionaceae bacterium]|jgi:altronate dehydratase large subunit|nr:UxaA family hydrolase [Desulfovibrionaceae bacterium]